MATIKFQSWPHLTSLLDDFLNHRLLIIGKARQIGITWLLAFYSVWKAKFFENVRVLVFSQGESEAHDVIGKCKFIDDNLPDWMRELRNPDSAGVIGFPATNSEIKAFPSTQKAGRSTDATLVITDEAEYHEYVDVNYTAVRPTISGGGQHIICSTANPLVTADKSFFKRMYIGAANGENGYHKVFLPWHVRPDRDEEWLKEETRGMLAWQAAAEYPSVEEDMLATLMTMPFFDNEILRVWLDNAPEPIKYEPLARHPTVKVWKPPIVGRRYAVFTDPSDGKTDPHVIICKDVQTGEWVCTSHGKVKADYCAQIHHDVVKAYNDAWNSYEINAIAGGIMSQRLVDLNTPNQCKRLTPEGNLKNTETRVGQFTGATAKKTQRDMLAQAILEQSIRIYDKDAMKELMAFYIPEGGDPTAPRGGHDDYISAGGGVEWIARHAHPKKVWAASGQYRG